MKYLAFERRYRLEGEPCPRCGGTGTYAFSARNLPRDCMNCRGLGRHLSRAARDLWREICELLGAPVLGRESRIQPKHLEQITGGGVRPGMAITTLDRPRAAHKVIRRVDRPTSGSVRVTFADRTVIALSDLTSVSRELTPAELRRVEAVMAERLGAGATVARRLFPRRVRA